jgi:hypothetical protein
MHGNLPPGSNARKELRARQSGPGPVRERNLNGPGAVFKSTFANACQCSESVTVCQRLASVPSYDVLLQAFELSPAALLAHAAASAAAAPLPRATHFKLLVTVFQVARMGHCFRVFTRASVRVRVSDSSPSLLMMIRIPPLALRPCQWQTPGT